MTENEVKIKKALENYQNILVIRHPAVTGAQILDLINSYEVEIKRLNRLCKFRKSLIDGLKKMLKRSEDIKVEAYKEFAEELKEDSKFHYDYGANLAIDYIEIDTIDNLLKRKVGGN